MGQRVFGRTTIISVGLTAFLLGLVLGRYLFIGQVIWILIAVLLFTPLLFRRSLLSLLSISIIGLLLGAFRGNTYRQQLLPYSVLAKQPITIMATATSDAVYGQRGQLEFDAGNIQLLKPYDQKLVGIIGVRGFGENMIYRGDKVVVSAKLYPARGARQGRMSFARIERVSRDNSEVNAFRRKFAAGLQSAVPEPLGSLGLGILIGQRTTLPDQLNQDLSDVGLTHIVAVSGYNLTIIVVLARQLLAKRSKYQSTMVTLGLIGLFLLITGNSASIVRAALVSALSLWAWYYGRIIKPHLLILFAAALTAGWFPTYLWSDVGWHLSFLAFVGVLIVAPLFKQRFLPRKKPKIILQLVLETSAAQIMTLPIIMFIFGRLSLVALLANMLVVPLIPLAMALSTVAGIAAMLAPALAGWLAWPATITLTYVVDIIGIMARLPKASINQAISVWQLILAYSLTVVLLFTWSRKKVKITDTI